MYSLHPSYYSRCMSYYSTCMVPQVVGFQVTGGFLAIFPKNNMPEMQLLFVLLLQVLP